TDGDGIHDYSMREFRDQRRDNDAASLTVNNVFNFRAIGAQHTLLFGADALRQDGVFHGRTAEEFEDGGVVPGLSLVNPVYGQTSAAAYDLASIPLRFTDARTQRAGMYVQDQVLITDRWNLLAG